MLRRIGWGVGGVMLLLLAAFASMVRIVPAPPAGAPAASSPAVTTTAPIVTGLSGNSGRLIVPVLGVDRTQLRDNWGESRADGAREHHAIDIMAPRGTPVLAAADGTVEKIFESVPGGHTVYVRLTKGDVVHYYAHLDGYAPGLREGEHVNQGQVIATVGSTGDASPDAPHLHFEVKAMQPGEGWWQGTNVNPFPLLAGNGSDG